MGFKIKLEIDVDDVVESIVEDSTIEDGGVYPNSTFTEALQERIVYACSQEIRKAIMPNALSQMQQEVNLVTTEFIKKELHGKILRKLRAGDFRSPRASAFVSYDDAIDKILAQSRIGEALETLIDHKIKEFQKELKARYDNVFAAKLVGSLKDNNMLRADIAHMLFDTDPDK